jgi:hypothetical protein
MAIRGRFVFGAEISEFSGLKLGTSPLLGSRKQRISDKRNSCYDCVYFLLTILRGNWMKQIDWILDVLVDLKSFASANDLGALAEQLDDTMLIAAAEIASLNEKATVGTYAEQTGSGPNPGGPGSHRSA